MAALLLSLLLASCSSSVVPSPTISPSPRGSASPLPSTTTPPTIGGPTPTPVLSPTQPTSTPASTPSSTPTIGTGGWALLGFGELAEAAWSPDAQHMLVAFGTATGPPETHFVGLLDRAGAFIRRYETAVRPVWVDATTFLLHRPEWEQADAEEWHEITPPNGTLSGNWLIGTVASDDLESSSLPMWLPVSSGLGALAFQQFDSSGRSETLVWEEGSLSAPIPGRPAGWSPDGSMLAIVLPAASGPSDEGPFEVLSWPGLEILHSGTASVAEISFDPNGRRFAYPTYRELPRRPREVPQFELTLNVVDVTVAGEIEIVAQENGAFQWLDDERLLVVGYGSNRATVYGLDGSAEDAGLVTGPDVIAAANGSTLVFYDDELDEPTFSVLRSDGVREIETPGALTGPAPVLAPDGSGIISVVRMPIGPGDPAQRVLLHNL